MKLSQNLGNVYAVVLSNYILKHFGPMSHLKLQKLLYYCEAYHLAYFKTNLVPDDFEAWVHGPVCRNVYNALKDTSILYSDIAFDKDNDEDPDPEINSSLNSSQKELLSFVLNDLSKWSAMDLETATHEELPWIEARKGSPASKICTNVISKKTMLEYYAEEINAN